MEFTLEELKAMAFALKDVRYYDKKEYNVVGGDNAALEKKLWKMIYKLGKKEVE